MPRLMMIKDGHLGGYIQGGDPATWCPHLWTWAVRRHGVRSVLDVGCGEAHSTRFFHDLGCDVQGVDGCAQAVRDSALPGRVALHDFCAGPFDPGRGYDLVWSCEFLEHVRPEYVPHILATFARATRLIFLTHAFPGQEDGHHHVNCRPSAYWITRIEALGFTCDVGLTRQARTITLADYPGTNHFARSGLVFRRTRPTPPVPVGISLASRLSARGKALRINQGFRWSAAYRHHRRAHRRRKRASRR